MCKQAGDFCLRSLGGEDGGFFWFSRPEGAKTNQPRATPWVPRQRIPGSPERAKQGENRGLATTLLRPFRAEIPDAVITQGGAPRLTPLRSALGCHVTPLRGKKRRRYARLPMPPKLSILHAEDFPVALFPSLLVLSARFVPKVGARRSLRHVGRPPIPLVSF